MTMGTQGRGMGKGEEASAPLGVHCRRRGWVARHRLVVRLGLGLGRWLPLRHGLAVRRRDGRIVRGRLGHKGHARCIARRHWLRVHLRWRRPCHHHRLWLWLWLHLWLWLWCHKLWLLWLLWLLLLLLLLPDGAHEKRWERPRGLGRCGVLRG